MSLHAAHPKRIIWVGLSVTDHAYSISQNHENILCRIVKHNNRNGVIFGSSRRHGTVYLLDMLILLGCAHTDSNVTSPCWKWLSIQMTWLGIKMSTLKEAATISTLQLGHVLIFLIRNNSGGGATKLKYSDWKLNEIAGKRSQMWTLKSDVLKRNY
jgi:hypothetical protein